MENSVLNNFSIDDLKNFRGDVCLYATNFEDNLGDKVQEEFSDLLNSNCFSYNISLATRTDCKLIVIDGDDFNPSKVAGLVKSYDVPIAIFIGNPNKIEKLKSCLLVHPLIVDKNTCELIDMKEDIEKNIEEKRKRDEAKRALEGENLNQKVENNDNSNVSKLEDSSKGVQEDVFAGSFFFSEPIKTEEPIGEIKDDVLEETKNINNEEKPKDVLVSTFFDFETIPEENNSTLDKVVEDNKVEKIEEAVEKEDKIEDFSDSLSIEVNELEKAVDFSKERRLLKELKEEEEKKFVEDNFFLKDKKLERVGCYTNDISIINVMEGLFGKLETIDVLNSKNKYDIVIIDISFALIERVLSFLQFQNCPAIIVSKRSMKMDDFKDKNTFDVFILEKPIMIPPEIIKSNFKEYLNHFTPAKKVQENRLNRPSIQYEKEMDRGSVSDDRGYAPYRKPTISSVKNEINKTNKRADKKISLEEIYQKMGLNDISIFNSSINRCIFISDDNKVIKYTPAGYLIEYRIKRLESKGLPKEEINNMMKEFEESDIRFQKRILQEVTEHQNVKRNY